VVEDTEPIGYDGKLIDAHDCSADAILNRKLGTQDRKEIPTAIPMFFGFNCLDLIDLGAKARARPSE